MRSLTADIHALRDRSIENGWYRCHAGFEIVGTVRRAIGQSCNHWLCECAQLVIFGNRIRPRELRDPIHKIFYLRKKWSQNKILFAKNDFCVQCGFRYQLYFLDCL